MTILKTTLLLGLAGLFVAGTADLSVARDRGVKDSYENHGAKPGMAPPVPGFALWRYEPGMCWKVSNKDRQFGDFIPCSEFFKMK
jgi:hypothetical protein